MRACPSSVWMVQLGADGTFCAFPPGWRCALTPWWIFVSVSSPSPAG